MRIALQPGTLFHQRYLISKQLGAGGMGSVYLAEQVDAKRKVALKILHSDDSSDEKIDRFLREFQVLSKLQHINVVTFYSAAITPEGTKYAVTEYITGKSLQTVLQEEGRLSWARVCNIGSQICDAIEYANAQGIVHRDLKPANIMLVNHPAPDTVKVIDFGLAKITSGDLMKTLTQTGEIIGSPHYMSPEQILGHNVDERSDLYSLACIIIECLSGRKIFDSDQALSIIRSHIHDDARKFLEHQFDKNDKALISSLARALAKEPEKRHKTASEFKNELIAICAQHESSTLASVGSANTTGKWGVFLLIPILLLAGIYGSSLMQKQNKVPAIKTSPSNSFETIVAKLYRDSYRLEEHLKKEKNHERQLELFEEYRMKVRKLNEFLHDVKGRELEEVENCKRLLNFSEIASDEPRIFRLETYHTIVGRYITMNDYDSALIYLEKERRILDEVTEELPSVRARLYSTFVSVYGIKHRFDDCLKYLPKAFAEYRKSNKETFLASDQGRAVQFLEGRPMFKVAPNKSFNSNVLYEVYETLAEITPADSNEAAKLGEIFSQLAAFFMEQHDLKIAAEILKNEELFLSKQSSSSEIEAEKKNCARLLKKLKQTNKTVSAGAPDSEN